MKKVVICLITAFSLMYLPFTANAAVITKDSGGNTFKKAWELTASGSNWLMRYGYNTTWINEDYTHTTHTNRNHTAIVTNGRGSFSKSAKDGKWAKIEVRHSGTSVQYSISY
ncbi:hypothetical protein [Bacillus kwashiorkori]|uniref:mediterrocin family bacteriocin n=1 Tax=Bacillus kwashiorkori TaxID=1522318 RepID=UPI0007829696|nr:hypothetical protein [Bacillus kwashiorkori]